MTAEDKEDEDHVESRLNDQLHYRYISDPHAHTPNALIAVCTAHWAGKLWPRGAATTGLGLAVFEYDLRVCTGRQLVLGISGCRDRPAMMLI